MLADDLGLHAVVIDHLIRGETLKIEPVCGVGLGHGLKWQADLGEIRVVLAPERRAPGLVQSLDGAVAALQPALEGGATVGCE